MAQPHFQTSFASGEWAPKLRSRVDVSRYHQGAALLRNFYVDFSGGGASTRPGTRYCNQCKALGARLIPFQPSVNISYVLEFGQNYIRFFSNGSPVLEAAVAIQSIAGSPVTVSSTSHGYVNGDWVFISGNYYIVINATPGTYQLTDLFGNNITTLAGTQAQRVYTIKSPFATSDLFPNQATGNPGIKFVQDVTSMIICHPSYVPQILTINSANNWTLTNINFGPTIAAPSGIAGTSNLGSGSWNYAYRITAVDNNGQESAPSGLIGLNSLNNIQTTQGAIFLSWGLVPGAVSYNIYKASQSFGGALSLGSQFGFIGNVTINIFSDSQPGLGPNFAITPPIISSPIIGGNVQSITLQFTPAITICPQVNIALPPAGGFPATAFATLGVSSIAINGSLTMSNPNATSPVGVVIPFIDGVQAIVQAASPLPGGVSWTITQIGIANPGSFTGAGQGVPTTVSPSAPQDQFNVFHLSNGWAVSNTTFNLVWIITSLTLTQGGFGYTSAPPVTFSPAGASAFTTVSPINQSSPGGIAGAAPVGNPRVPAFFQQRLTLASPNAALQTFYMSQPGSFFNFNVTNPSQPDNAITGSIISEELNDIRSLIPVPTGLLALTGKGAWLINGGGGISTANPITPANVSATPQAFNGANDLRPLKVNFDALFVTNKGNYVRDANYNIYANIFTGTDITILSNHLFFGFSLVDWCWAEEPFKTCWAVRSDGQVLSLAYIKEQEATVVGWAHHDTNGSFTSTCSVIETNSGNTVDAVYFIVQRTIQGQTVAYVERLVDRYFPYGYEDSWSVDCALQTIPQLTVTTGNLTISGSSGSVTLTDTVATPFTSGMVNSVVRAGGGIYKIATFTSASQVTATVSRTPTILNQYTLVPFAQTSYTIWNPITTVSGLTQLVGQNVVGVADGAVVGVTSPLVVSASGTVTLPTAASKITLGLAFTPQLQTLPLDLGEPTVQGKRKKISGLTVRVADTLGLQAGTTFPNVVAVKDFLIGAIPTTSNGPALIADLVNPSSSPNTVDGRLIIDQSWQEAGSYCIQQNLPYPATILGVMPEVTMGDTGK